jgi:uncharacterized protein GlcG (DUF336 family)
MRMPLAFRQTTAVALALSLTLSGCGGGDSGSGGTFTPTPTPTSASRFFADPAPEALTTAEVQQIIAQAVGEAKALNYPAIVAVVDRVGNVLAVFRMNGAATRMLISQRTATGEISPREVDAQGLEVEATMGAISKAVTAAYLSSSGNAFSTRTASMIVQEHFPPAPNTPGLESGPLFGVQFSQLPCSDLAARFATGNAGSAAFIGPKRAPLGLAADPGGLPLYKNGVVVGGIGVMADGDYAYDPDVTNVDGDPEEFMALAGIQGFAPPAEIRADRIPVDGSTLRFSDARVEGLHPLQTSFSAINNTAGTLIPVRGYYDGTAVLAGTPYGTEASGIRRATSAEFSLADAYVLSNGSGTNRYPIKGGTDAAAVGTALTAAEVRAVLEEAFTIMTRARAQIRRPLDSRAQVSISVVDTYGEVLGLVRGPDAPIFGIDVSLQKARQRSSPILSPHSSFRTIPTPRFPPSSSAPAISSAIRRRSPVRLPLPIAPVATCHVRSSLMARLADRTARSRAPSMISAPWLPVSRSHWSRPTCSSTQSSSKARSMPGTWCSVAPPCPIRRRARSASPTASRFSRARCRSTATASSSVPSASRAMALTRTT